MTFDPNQHHRRSIRLAGFNYGAMGAYFVTICVARRRCAFGQISNGAMRLHPYGRIVVEEWQNSASLRVEIELDEFVVMPDHFHGIVWIVKPPSVAQPTNILMAPSRVLGALVNGFKGAVTRRINAHRAERDLSKVVVWQRNYHEHIIRNEIELDATRRYIIENPLHWASDEENENSSPPHP